jgi:hypothetical protein
MQSVGLGKIPYPAIGRIMPACCIKTTNGTESAASRDIWGKWGHSSFSNQNGDIPLFPLEKEECPRFLLGKVLSNRASIRPDPAPDKK